MANNLSAAHRSTQPSKLPPNFDVANRDMDPETRVITHVITHNAVQVDEIGTDDFALSLLQMTLPDWMPKWLQRKLKKSLRGFTEDSALWIAESLMDCYNGYALATIGIAHIDAMLWSLYAEILQCAREKGVKLANHW